MTTKQEAHRDTRDHSVPDEHHIPRTGHWLSQDRRHHHAWLKQTIDHVEKSRKELHPVLKEFREMVYTDSRLYMLFSSMFDQIPHNKDYLTDPTGEHPQVRDFDHMLDILNHVLTTAPAWTDAGHSVGLVGVPISALLDWPMGTRAGFAVFLDPKVNAMLKKVLNAWGDFLKSPESAEVLGEDPCGWFGKEGKQSLVTVANRGQTNHSFEEMFQCDPQAKHHGFKSWDDFFTRLFREGIRPVASPDDDNIIANPCESKTYKVAYDVRRREKFWVKGQPYSVVDMLANDPLSDQFVGGTIYQAFLSALSYHRWHTPVTGTVKKAYIVDGTYFSEPLSEDYFKDKGETQSADNKSQEYLSALSTRAIIFIEADNPKIGLMAFLGVGMTEVSTCEITVKEGQKVKKGDQLGSFHFGGSTWCGIWRKGVKLEGFPKPGTEYNIPVRAKLAHVV